MDISEVPRRYQCRIEALVMVGRDVLFSEALLVLDSRLPRIDASRHCDCLFFKSLCSSLRFC